ncbi:hypothetical protein BX070DRAFT_196747 [Coemansia spiralis]|nr:hypothetical protein BX070DRAFT_196747 [Coemansia spiralis]
MPSFGRQAPAPAHGILGGPLSQGTLTQTTEHSGSESDSEHKRRRLHKRDQSRRFDCDICNRSFARQFNLKTHRLTHFPETHESRPFKCEFCPKAFTRKHDLQRHAGLHKRADKYACPRCAVGFQRKDALKRHMDSECN